MARFEALLQRPLIGVDDDLYEHPENGIVFLIQLTTGIPVQITPFNGELNPCLCLCCFRFTVTEFRNEGRLISALSSRFSDVGADRSGGTLNLVRQRIPLLDWKRSRQFKQPHCSSESALIGLEIRVPFDQRLLRERRVAHRSDLDTQGIKSFTVTEFVINGLCVSRGGGISVQEAQRSLIALPFTTRSNSQTPTLSDSHTVP